MKKTLLLTLLSAAMATPFSAQASSNDAGLHFVLTGGLTGGGDTIMTARYTDGTSKNIKSGGLINFGLGVLWQPEGVPVATSVTANYHIDNASARNGSMRFSRYPLEAMAHYTGVEKWRFGVGVRLVQDAKATAAFEGDKETLKFKDTTGAVVEVGYGISQRAWINLRYVKEKYRPTTFTNIYGQTTRATGDSIDGSHVGLNFLFQF